jgi:hypothetical protein
MGGPEPSAQKFEQLQGQHGVTVLASLALPAAENHPLAVHVGDLEMDGLGSAETCAIGDAKGRPALQAGSAIEKAGGLRGRDDDGRPDWLTNGLKTSDDHEIRRVALKKKRRAISSTLTLDAESLLARPDGGPVNGRRSLQRAASLATPPCRERLRPGAQPTPSPIPANPFSNALPPRA